MVQSPLAQKNLLSNSDWMKVLRVNARDSFVGMQSFEDYINHRKYQDKVPYECVLQMLAQNEMFLTFDEILKFCSYVIKTPIKEIYGEARKLLVSFHSVMQTTDGKSLLKLTNTPGLYSSPHIDDIQFLFKKISQYKHMDLGSSDSSDDEKESPSKENISKEILTQVSAQLFRFNKSHCMTT
jgi:hypothetical protein